MTAARSTTGSAPPRRLDWARDGRDWPHHAHSRFVQAAGLRWHVQQFAPLGAAGAADAAPILLLHGTGASTHSWRDVAPLLAQRHPVIAVDLPGHAFTTPAPPGGATLPAMARALGALLRTLGVQPVLIVGHSAGAAIAARMVLDGHAAPRALAAVNGALRPLEGWPGRLFAPAARLLTSVPGVPHFFAWRAADPKLVLRLLQGTGSQLDPHGVALYGRLVRDAGHAAGALAMVTHWDLVPLWHDLGRLRTPLHLLAAEGDRAVPVAQSRQVADRVAGARLTIWPNPNGHLAHEERPAEAAQWVLGCLGAP